MCFSMQVARIPRLVKCSGRASKSSCMHKVVDSNTGR